MQALFVLSAELWKNMLRFPGKEGKMRGVRPHNPLLHTGASAQPLRLADWISACFVSESC